MVGKREKGVMSTLGIIMVVLLALVILIIAVLMATGISIGVVKSQQYHLVSIMMPYGFYNESTHKLLSITGAFKNPNPNPITIQYIVIQNATIPLNIVIDPNKDYRLNLDLSSYNIYVSSDDIARGYIVAHLVTDAGAEVMHIEIYGVK